MEDEILPPEVPILDEECTDDLYEDHMEYELAAWRFV